MGHSIQYCIPLSGAEFNALLPEELRADEHTREDDWPYEFSIASPGPDEKGGGARAARPRFSSSWRRLLSRMSSRFGRNEPDGGGEGLSIDVFARITVVWTRWNYSALLAGNVPPETIASIEGFLRSVYPTGELVRFDEFLDVKYQALRGDDWEKDPSSAAEFWHWLRLQDPLYWSLVP